MNDSGYESLAIRVVIFAAKDYRRALRVLRFHPNNMFAKYYRDDAERFFRSAWFQQLTTLDGEKLLRRIRKEEAYG